MSEKEETLPEMTFWNHIDALRKVLLKIGVVLLIITSLFFWQMKNIFDNIILAPCRSDFILYKFFAYLSSLCPYFPDFVSGDFSVHLINIQLASQFFIHMSTSFWLAIVFSFPIIIYLLWGFVKPALYHHEQKGIRKAFLFGNFMFFVGVAVGYFVVFPITLRFLAEYQVSALVPNQISLDSYMDNFLIMILIMGIIFEMPLLAWALSAAGLLTRNFFRKYRRHAIAILLILAAIVTPTGDPFTLMVVFLPLYGLFELSAYFVKPTPPQEDDEDKDDEDSTLVDYIPHYKHEDDRK